MFRFEDPTLRRWSPRLLRRLPPVSGSPIYIQKAEGLRDRRGPVHAGSFLRERRMVFDCTRSEFPRIFVHELFHFVWLRLGNRLRREFEDLLLADRCRGELGWSAEWRKRALSAADIGARNRRWREYCCESFCDTAAWLYSGVDGHPEFSLCRKSRAARRQWFRKTLEMRSLSI